VITEAGNDPKVVSLVYVAAFAPDAGQSIGEISQAFAKPAGADQVQPQPNGFLLLSQKGIERISPRTDAAEKAHLVAAQPKTSGAIFEAKPTAAAWRAKPAWYVVASNDRMIDPEQERAWRHKSRPGHGTAVEPCRDVVASDRRREVIEERLPTDIVHDREDVSGPITEGFNRALTTHDSTRCGDLCG